MNPDTPAPPPRNAASFWIKVPAILAVLLAAGFCLSLVMWNPARMQLRYQTISQQALDRKDYTAALVAAERLLSFGDASKNEAIFKMAQANFALGRTATASGLFEIVAPLDKAVFAPAHLFVARILLSRPVQNPSVRQAVLIQLGNVLKLEPDSIEARGLLSRYQSPIEHLENLPEPEAKSSP